MRASRARGKRLYQALLLFENMKPQIANVVKAEVIGPVRCTLRGKDSVQSEAKTQCRCKHVLLVSISSGNDRHSPESTGQKVQLILMSALISRQGSELYPWLSGSSLLSLRLSVGNEGHSVVLIRTALVTICRLSLLQTSLWLQPTFQIGQVDCPT